MTAGKMIPFQYSGFYDVPRYIALIYRERTILLRSEFDDDLDEYPNSYSVYLISESVAASSSAGHWEFLNDTQMTYIGEIPIADVCFDSRDFKELDASCLDGLLN